MKPTMHTSLLRGPCLLVLLIALLESGLLAPAAPSSAAQSGQHQVYLPLIAGSGGQGGGATSEALIPAALKRGEIDDETALLYRVFAAFDDQRLPAKYH